MSFCILEGCRLYKPAALFICGELMKKNFMQILIIAFLMSFVTDAMAGLKVCRPRQVIYEGGAIACPKCAEAAVGFVSDPKYSDIVNEHMRKALGDDLDSAKWLMAYFSDPAHKNYAEAKKWFGRALGIGADAAELRLPDGYDEPYLNAAEFSNSYMSISIASSCIGLDKAWNPQCYSQAVESFTKRKEGARDVLATGQIRFSTLNHNFEQETIFYDFVEIYQHDKSTVVVFNAVSAVNKAYIRKDYFRNDGEPEFTYLGSSREDPQIEMFSGMSGQRMSEYKQINDQDYGAVNGLMKDAAATCDRFELSVYPVAGKRRPL